MKISTGTRRRAEQYPVSGSGSNLSQCFQIVDYFKLGVPYKMVFAQQAGPATSV